MPKEKKFWWKLVQDGTRLVMKKDELSYAQANMLNRQLKADDMPLRWMLSLPPHDRHHD